MLKKAIDAYRRGPVPLLLRPPICSGHPSGENCLMLARDGVLPLEKTGWRNKPTFWRSRVIVISPIDDSCEHAKGPTICLRGFDFATIADRNDFHGVLPSASCRATTALRALSISS